MNYSIDIYKDDYLKFWQRQFSDKIVSLYSNFDTYIEAWEDDFYQTINNHEDVFNTDGLGVMFRDAFVPMIIPIITLLIALFTIFVIPRCFYVQLCRSRRNLSEFKHAWLFAIKIFLTLNIITLLIAFAFASIQSSLNLELTIRNNIGDAHDLVDDLHNEKAKFELQLHDVNNSVITTLLSIRNMISNMPQNIFNSLNASIGNELNIASKSYSNIMSKSDIIFDRSGLKIGEDSIQNILEIELNTVENFVEKFNNNTETIITAIESDKYDFDEKNKINILNDLNKIQNYMKNIRGKYQVVFPNWTNMHENLQNTYFILMPKINKSLEFINEYPVQMQNNIKNEVAHVCNVTEKFRNETEIIIEHLFSITRNIYHEDVKRNVRKLLNFSNSTLYSINRNYSLCNDTYFSSILIVIPSIHGFLCGFLILFLCIAIIYQMNCSRKNFIMNSKFNKCTIIMIKLIILFALLLLWTGLVLAAICYTGALSLSMICRPIMTNHLYTKYTDNVQVWDNKTWLDHIVYPWHHNYKLKDILEKCTNNITVYQAFDVEKYWQVSDLFRNNEIQINKEELINSIKVAIDSVNKPNGEICDIAKNTMNAVEKEITLLSPHIMYDVETYQSNDLKIHLHNMIQNYGDLIELRQNLDIINYIQNQKLDSMLSNFMEFKYLLKSQQNELTNIENMEQQITDKLNSNMHLFLTNKINHILESMNNLLSSLEENLLKRIKYEIGNCYIFPMALDKMKTKACLEMPLLLIMTWILLSFSSLFLILSIFCCSQLCTAIIEIRHERQIWREKLEFEKLSARRKRLLSGTLLFDRSGRFMGDSRTLLAQDAPEALIIHPEGQLTRM